MNYLLLHTYNMKIFWDKLNYFCFPFSNVWGVQSYVYLTDGRFGFHSNFILCTHIKKTITTSEPSMKNCIHCYLAIFTHCNLRKLKFFLLFQFQLAIAVAIELSLALVSLLNHPSPNPPTHPVNVSQQISKAAIAWFGRRPQVCIWMEDSLIFCEWKTTSTLGNGWTTYIFFCKWKMT